MNSTERHQQRLNNILLQDVGNGTLARQPSSVLSTVRSDGHYTTKKVVTKSLTTFFSYTNSLTIFSSTDSVYFFQLVPITDCKQQQHQYNSVWLDRTWDAQSTGPEISSHPLHSTVWSCERRLCRKNLSHNFIVFWKHPRRVLPSGDNSVPILQVTTCHRGG